MDSGTFIESKNITSTQKEGTLASSIEGKEEMETNEEEEAIEIEEEEA